MEGSKISSFILLERHPQSYAAFQQWRAAFGRLPTTAKKYVVETWMKK